jgi:L-threonylcarbamoyladenylate synthase
MMPDVFPFDHPEVPRLVEAALETGQTIIFPTDTVYGIGGNPWDEGVVGRVCSLKARAPDRPFTLHLASVEAVSAFAQVGAVRERLHRLLPGPYTLLLRAKPGAPPSAVLDGVVGVRVPNHPFFRTVLRDLGRPLFGTSVNRSGQPPLSEPNEIIERFPSADLILTGPVGSGESTILDLTVDPPRLVRGAVPDGP